MIKVTLEFATVDEAITALAKVRADSKDAPKAETAKDAAAPAKDKAAGKSAGATDKAKTTEPAAAPAPTASAPPAAAAPTPPPASSVPTGYGIVADKIATKAKTHRAEVVALLGKYNAKSGKDLKADQYEAFVAEIDAIGAETELA